MREVCIVLVVLLGHDRGPNDASSVRDVGPFVAVDRLGTGTIALLEACMMVGKPGDGVLGYTPVRRAAPGPMTTLSESAAQERVELSGLVELAELIRLVLSPWALSEACV